MEKNTGIFKKILFSVIITLIFLVIIESAANLVEYLYPDRLVTELKIPHKEEGTYRIFVYGGSTVWGVPIKQFGFVSQLEFWLRDSNVDKSLEVYNFGLSGKSSSFVRQKVEETITNKPDLLIVLSGHNEFLYRGNDSNFIEVVQSLAVTRVLMRLKMKVMPLSQHVMPDSREVYDRDSVIFKKKSNAYMENMSSVVKIARTNIIPLILITLPSNFAGWPPSYKMIEWDGYRKQYESWVEEINSLLENKSIKETYARVQELTRAYGEDDPILTYLLAKTLEAGGEYEEAGSYYIKAKDLDPIPWRALSKFNDHIRDLAENDGVYLVDLEHLFKHRARNGLVSFSLIADNVHPTPLGNAIIARELIKLMGRQDLYVEEVLVPSNLDEGLNKYISKTIPSEERKTYEKEYMIKNAQYSMKTPFYNFKASRMYLDKALAIDSSDWRIWLNLATLAIFENRIEEGREQLKKAIILKGTPIDPFDRGNAPYIGEALRNAGIRLEDLQ